MADSNNFKNLAYHPYNIMMILMLAGLTMLFLGISAAYLYNRVQANLSPLQVPTLFVLNTFIIMSSSYTMHRANIAYRNDNTLQYQLMLAATIVLSLFFMGMQYVAWQQMFAMNIKLTTGTMAAYLYAISFLHFLHIIGGLPFFFHFLWVAYRRMREPVSVLVYFSDPLKRLKLQLLTLYWHFLDILWIYVVLFFYANYLIQ